MFVLNNAFARDILKQRDIENVLGTKIAYDLPYDPFLYLKAVNEGVPIVLGAMRTLASERWSSSPRRSSARTASAVPAAATRGLFGACAA